MMASIRFGSIPRAFKAGSAEAPKSTSKAPFAVSTKKAGIGAAARAEGVARPDDCQLHGDYAAALGRADTAACQRFTLAAASGKASRAGFMKSTVTSAVMSATE